MFNEKTIEKIRSTRLGSYAVYSDDMDTLWKANQCNRYTSMFDAYCYGFLRGQRAAKAAAKRKAVRA